MRLLEREYAEIQHEIQERQQAHMMVSKHLHEHCFDYTKVVLN